MALEYFDPRKVFGNSVYELAKDNEDIVVISADSGGSSGFADFMKEFPERYVECGIMEQFAVGFSSGLATQGKIPVFCAIAPFVTLRPYEMFRNDIGYMRQNAKIVGRNSGITYSDLGSTHHSLEDFAIISMIPEVVVLAPQDPNEIKGAVKAMIEYKGPVYMRIGNPPIPNILPDEEFVIGKAKQLNQGEQLTVISVGTATENAYFAVQELNAEGYSIDHLGLGTVVPLDEEAIINSVKKTGKILTVEEHYEKGGIGSQISDMLMLNGVQVEKFQKIAVPHEYATSGPYKDILAKYQLDKEGIKNKIKNILI
ncbi:MAG TPA: transketolase [Clostridiaceae bacterium]|nr:transketolase [Clostridiaceae bacterium]